MNESSDAINWIRWLFYLLAGVPAITWLFFTRDRVLRLVAVVAFLLFLQDNIVGRRYVIGGLSIAPSTVLAYVALVAEVLAQRKLPALRGYLPLWVGFVFFAASNVVVGSLGTGLWGVNFKQFQIFYLEAPLIFAYALMVFRAPDESVRYARWLMLLGLGVAVVHMFTAATGFRFRNAIDRYSELYYAGVLDNTNSLGSLYAMWVPVGLSLAVGPRQPRLWRVVTITALIGMLASLILSGSRGGVLFTVLTSFLAFAISRAGFSRALVATLVAAVAAFAGYFVLDFFAADALRDVLGIAREEGGQSDRLLLFARYSAMLMDHPFGIGMSAANFDRLVAAYGIPGVVSAHNIYLDIALQTGLLGLALFLALAFGTLLENRRATRATRDPRQREALVFLFLPVIGFLGVGFFEPIYTISNKLNHLFWISCGLSVGASQLVLAARRAERETEAEPLGDTFASPAHARPS